MYLKKELYGLMRSDDSIFDFILNSSLDGLWYWDLENPENEWMNARFWTVLGYNPDEMPHKSSAWQSIIDQDDLKVANVNFTKHCENPDHPYDQIVRYKHKNGSTKWIRCRGLAIRDNAGKPIRMLGAHQDVTDIKNSEQGLLQAIEIAKESEEKLFSLFNNINTCVVVYRPDNNGENFIIQEMNIASEKLEKINKTEIIGKFVTEIFPGVVDFGLFAVFQQVFKTGVAQNHSTSFYKDERISGWRDNYVYKLSTNEIVATYIDLTDQKVAAQELLKAKEKAEESEIFINKIIDSQFDTFFVFDPTTGKPVKWNQRFEVVSEYSGEEIMNMVAPDDFYDKNDLIHSNKKIEEVFANGQGIIELELLTKTGKRIPFEYSATLVPNTNLFISIGRDISARKKAEKELIAAKEKAEESERKQHILFDNAGDAILIHDAKSPRILSVNQQACKQLGYTHNELISLPAFAVDSPGQKQFMSERIAKVMEQGHLTFETVHQRKDGSLVPTEVSAKLFIWDGQPVIMSICRDITERKQAEAIFKDIIENNPMSIQIVDKEGYTLRWNPAFIELFGSVPPPEFSIFDDLKSKSAELEQLISLVKNGEMVHLPDIYFNAHDAIAEAPDIPLWIRALIFPLKDSAGKPERFVFMHENITEQKIAEQELIKAKVRVEESEARYHLIASNTSDSIWVMDADLRFTYLSPSTEKLFGYSLVDWETLDWNSFVKPDYMERVLNAFGGLKSGNKEGVNPVSVIVRHKNGTERWVEFSANPLYDDNNVFTGVVGITRDITERKLAEEALHLTRFTMDAASDSIFWMTPDAHIVDVNAAGCRNLGYTREEILQLSVSGIDVNYNAGIWPQHFAELRQRGSITFESELRTKDGRLIQVEIVANYIKHGGEEYNCAFVRDITERKLAEEKIREKDLQFRKLSANVPDLIYQFTRKPDGTYCVPVSSEGIKNIFGCSPEDVIDDFAPIARVIFPEDSERVIHDIEYSAEHLTYFTCEFRVQIPGKPIQWILSRSTPEKLPDGSITWYGFNADITERKQAELLLMEKSEEIAVQNEELNKTNQELIAAKEKTEESEEKFRLLHENAGMGIGYYSPDGIVLSYNQIAAKHMNGNPEDFIGKSIFDLYPKENADFYFNRIQNAIISSQPMVYEDFVQLPKEDKWFFSTFTKIENSQQKILGIQIISQDVTKLKTTEIELQKAKEKAEESDHLKSAFLANMSHEIRTPMNGILGFADLLKEPGLTGDEQQKYIGIIEKSGNRMLNIINDIIDISKIEAGLMELDIKESNINEQIEYVYSFFKPEAETKGLKLAFSNTLPAKEAIIQTDREKLYAILTNLVKNAIKYTEKGSIEFGYKTVETHSPAQKAFGGRASLQFYVKDTGIGIPHDRQEAIFERFIQADIADTMARQGAGLGLAISKAYIEMLGGKIWVESETGIGSTFYFTLPYNTEPDAEIIDQQSVPSEKSDAVIKLKILIVEDDEVSEMLIDSLIKRFSKVILKARTGVESVEVCRDNPDIDLILMDIRLPEMGGYEATKQIREFNKEVVIIAQTAYGLTGDREKSIESGCNDYIAKPINKDKLLSLIQKYFNK